MGKWVAEQEHDVIFSPEVAKYAKNPEKPQIAQNWDLDN